MHVKLNSFLHYKIYATSENYNKYT